MRSVPYRPREPRSATRCERRRGSETLAAGWDSFWAKLGPGLLGPSKDLSYLKWRYIDHPTFQYEIRLALHGSEILGLTVYRLEKIRDRDEKVLRVVEFLARPEAESPLASSLVPAAILTRRSSRTLRTSERVGHPWSASDSDGSEKVKTGDLSSCFQPLESRRSESAERFWLSATLRRSWAWVHAQLRRFLHHQVGGDQDRPIDEKEANRSGGDGALGRPFPLSSRVTRVSLRRRPSAVYFARRGRCARVGPLTAR